MAHGFESIRLDGPLLPSAALALPLFLATPEPALAQSTVSTTSQDPAVASPPDAAQGTAPVAEIVVTARRRAESLFDVPVAVTALSAEDINRYAANDITKIAQVTPNLNIASKTAGGAGAGVFIRGIGTDGSNVGFDQAVSINIDGVQVSRGRALWQSYFDIRQVEVLKGPQALFFGKNSPAGVISITTAGGTDEFEANLRAAYEFRADEVIGEAAISGPLSELLRGRVAVRARRMEGWIHNDAVAVENPLPFAPPITAGAKNSRVGERELNGRVTLDVGSGGPFSATLKVLGTRFRDDGSVSQLELVHCAAGEPPLLVTILGNQVRDTNSECRADWRITSSDPGVNASGYLNGRDGVPYTDQDTWLGSLTLNYDFGNVTLTSVTGYYDNDSAYLMNNDWSSFVSISATEHEKYEQFTEELRLFSNFDVLNFMVGAFFQDHSLDFERSMNLDYLPPDPATGRRQWTNHLAASDGKTYSVFGQLTWDITDQFELAGGARWTRETKDSFVSNTYCHPAVCAAFPVRRVDSDFSDENISPEVTLSYRPTTDVTIYGAYKTGYKSGGAGLSAVVVAGLTESQFAYGPEKAQGFEVGFKGRLVDGRLRVTGSAYRYTFDDLQVSSWDPTQNSYIISNAAKARQQGVEVEASFDATETLQLRGSIAYNRSRYRSFPNAQCYSGQTEAQGCIGGVRQDLSGRPTINAPEWTGSAGFSYTQPIGDFVVGLTADAQFSDDYYFVQTQSPFARQDAFARLNASLRLYPSPETWEIALIGRNLTNEKVLVSGQDRPGGIGDLNGALARPREVLLQLSYKF